VFGLAACGSPVGGNVGNNTADTEYGTGGTANDNITVNFASSLEE
jgi:hypothetical protein